MKAFRGSTVASSAATTSSGAYALTSLPVGTYTVCVDGSGAVGGTSATGYTSECFDDVPWSGTTLPAGTTPVAVSASQTTRADAALGAVGATTISGTVTGATGGQGVAGVQVLAYQVSGGLATSFSSARTTANGSYTLNNVPPRAGGYYLCFDPSSASGTSASGYQGRCYRNQPYDRYPGSGSTPVVVSSGTPVAGIDQSLPSASAITGRVRAAGGAALGGVNVLVYAVASGQLGTGFSSARTKPDGSYAVTGLAPNTTGYNVCFDARSATGGTSPTGYLGQCWKNQTWDGTSDPPATAARVPLRAGVSATSVDTALPVGGAITGTVRSASASLAADATGLAGVVVDIYDSDGRYLTRATTGSSGAYTVTGLRPGASYEACFDASAVTGRSSSSGYLDQCYRNVSWDGSSGVPARAVPITIPTSTAVADHIDARLSAAASIGGTVTAVGGGAPLRGVAVSVVDISHDDPVSVGATVLTGADGTYAVHALSASSSLVVCFDASAATGGSASGGYLSRCYADATWDGNPSDIPSGVTSVRTTPGTTTTADAALPAAASIGGTVRSASAGLGQVDVTVREAGVVVGSARTAANGSYTVGSLPASSNGVAVCFEASHARGGSSATGYADQCYDGVPWDGVSDPPSASTTIPLTAGQQRAGVDATLGAGGNVSGKVTGTGATPLAGIGVTVFRDEGHPVASAVTAANGRYTVRGLSPGDYTLCFDPGTSTSVYGDDCPTTPVHVRAAATTTVDEVLVRGGLVSGRVTAASGGGPVGGVDVFLYNHGGTDPLNDFDAFVHTGANGKYAFSGLPADARGYVVCFRPDPDSGTGAATGLRPECTDDVAWTGAETELPAGVTARPLTAGASLTIDASLSAGGAISGIVTGPGGPVGGVSVTVFDSAGHSVANVLANAGGTAKGGYVVRSLAPGTYVVCVDASNASGESTTGYRSVCFTSTAWDPSRSRPPSGATRVRVAAGTAAKVNVALPVGAAIAGTVTAAGAGVSAVSVDVFDANGEDVGFAQTSWDGAYRVAGLPAGHYRVCFDPSYVAVNDSGTGFVAECFNNVPWPGDHFQPAPGAPAVAVTPGRTTPVSVNLDTAGAITGTVTAAVGGARLQGVSVEVFDPSGNEVAFPRTRIDGTYRVTGLTPGSYFVCFDPRDSGAAAPGTGYLAECWRDVAWTPGDVVPSGARAVTVSTARTSAAVDAALATAGGIAGTVTAAAGGTPLSNVAVYVTGARGVRAFASTDGSGAYRVPGLAPGAAYTVCFDGSEATGTARYGYVRQCWRNVAWGGGDVPSGATRVAVTAGALTTGIDGSLAAAGAITGRVTSAADGSAIDGVAVTLHDRSGEQIAYVVTDADGTYTAPGLTPGGSGYVVCFDASSVEGAQYSDECYDDQPWDGVSDPPATSTAVRITSGAARTVNAALGSGAGIAGTVTGPGGGAVADVTVQALDEFGNEVARATTDVDGRYVIAPLPADDYTVCFDASAAGGSSSTGLRSECYDGIGWAGPFDPPPNGTTPVTVSAGTVHTGVDASLVAGGAIAGTVTAADGGAGLSDVAVTVYDPDGFTVAFVASTDGDYRIVGLASGVTYRVCFDGSQGAGGSSAAGYESQCYSGVPWTPHSSPPDSATGITLSAGESRTGIDAALDAAGAITGTVTASGMAVANVSVSVYDSTGSSIAYEYTDTTGAYRVTGLASGSYLVCFDPTYANDPPPGGYAGQCYDDVAWSPNTSQPAADATPVVVSLGAVHGGVDAALALGAALAGTVTETGTGDALSNVQVFVSTNSGEPAGSGLTGPDGTYTVSGLPAGSYRVCFATDFASGGQSPTGRYADECYDNVAWDGSTVPSGATAVTATVGTVRFGVDAALDDAG